ncbi:hypothetical protein L6R53_31300, partial [Myxococcota bacterium]|nr:hypothetical protein [Myxococcota bacterium]
GGDGGGGDGGGGDGGGGDGGGGDGGGGDGGTSEVAAHSGRWIYSSVDVVTTSCEAVVDFLPTAAGSTFFVTDSTTASFTKEISELAESTTCTLGGGGLFTCADIVGEFAVAEYDVMLPTSLSADGVLFDELTMEGSYQVELDCVGDNCDLAEVVYGFTFPCTFDLDWAASHESAG